MNDSADEFVAGELEKQSEPVVASVVDSKVVLASAVAAAERLEKANKELAVLLDRQEKLALERVFDGRAAAGVPQKRDADSVERDDARKWLEGTGFEDLV